MTSETILRTKLVDELKQKGCLKSPAVQKAFLTVSRHRFLPDVPLPRAYADESIVIKQKDSVVISSASQPSIMATMLEQLELSEGLKVLEVGTGSGYNAALMAAIVGPGGSIVTLEIDEEIAAQAARRIRECGHENVVTLCTDGSRGHEQSAPFDRIIITAGCSDIAEAWVRQLKLGGVLVVPLRLNGPQLSIGFKKVESDHLVSFSAHPCGFAPIRGGLAGADSVKILGRFIAAPDPRIDEAKVSRLLASEPIEKDVPEIDERFTYFAVASGQRVLSLWTGPSPNRPAYMGWAIVTDDGLVTVSSGPAQKVDLYGGESAYQELLRLHEGWVSLGRPGLDELTVEARPVGSQKPRENATLFSGAEFDYWMYYR
jgi:protein-L-isoaspartate(D-aspartate) O-methyltransferase